MLRFILETTSQMILSFDLKDDYLSFGQSLGRCGSSLTRCATKAPVVAIRYRRRRHRQFGLNLVTSSPGVLRQPT
jgi:hypothetical protein